jgi:hypothetical protein
VEGESYSSVEQFFQKTKASFADDTSIVDSIMSTDIPSIQKNLAKRIKNLDEDKWHSIAPEVMHNGLLAKFGQNQDLGSYLLSTGQKNLYESSPHDLRWGSGLSLDNKFCLCPNKHSGENLLGKILETVRNQLSNIESTKDHLQPSSVTSSPMQ